VPVVDGDAVVIEYALLEALPVAEVWLVTRVIPDVHCAIHPYLVGNWAETSYTTLCPVHPHGSAI
jgi:hypothetical protein